MNIDNPYWDIVKTIPHDNLFSWRGDSQFSPRSYPDPDIATLRNNPSEYKSEEKRVGRSALVQKYAWAIPSPSSLNFVMDYLKGRDVVEIGAGRDYWLWMLKQLGAGTSGYDRCPPNLEVNHYFHNYTQKPAGQEHDRTMFHRVEYGDPNSLHAIEHQRAVLFLCWPDYNSPFGADALKAYEGDTVIYIGEGESGCTGDDDMFDILSEEWTLVERDPNFVQWSGLHDDLEVYTRE